jgi:hypothetical protein
MKYMIQIYLNDSMTRLAELPEDVRTTSERR